MDMNKKFSFVLVVVATFFGSSIL